MEFLYVVNIYILLAGHLCSQTLSGIAGYSQFTFVYSIISRGQNCGRLLRLVIDCIFVGWQITKNAINSFSTTPNSNSNNEATRKKNNRKKRIHATWNSNGKTTHNSNIQTFEHSNIQTFKHDILFEYKLQESIATGNTIHITKRSIVHINSEHRADIDKKKSLLLLFLHITFGWPFIASESSSRSQ